MIADALAALAEILSPPFRSALVKVMGLTLLVLLAAVALLDHGLLLLLPVMSAWLATTLHVLLGLGLVVGSVFLVAPVSAIVAGFFIDELAAHVERDVDPAGPPGRALPIGTALVVSARFGALSFGVTVVALLLLFVPGVNAVAFIGANAYLLGRQYFEFVALRHLSYREAEALRRRHGGRIFLAGLLMAALVSVPILNLLTPLFGTALMVRVFKRLPGQGPRSRALFAEDPARPPVRRA